MTPDERIEHFCSKHSMDPLQLELRDYGHLLFNTVTGKYVGERADDDSFVLYKGGAFDNVTEEKG